MQEPEREDGAVGNIDENPVACGGGKISSEEKKSDEIERISPMTQRVEQQQQDQNDGDGTVFVISNPRTHLERHNLPPLWRSFRGFFVFMGFLGLMNVYALRVNLSVAIVAMVNHTAIDPPPSKNFTNSCPSPPLPKNTTVPSEDGPFVWSNDAQSLILSGFYWGYVCLQFPSGYMSSKYGGKWIFGLGIFGTSILTVLSPFIASDNYFPFFVIRVLEGLCEGVTFPAMHAMLAVWAPPFERSTMAAVVYAGAVLGTVIANSATGEVCDILGWKWAFWLFGSLGCLWFVFWSLLVADRPSRCRWISAAERKGIQESIGGATSDTQSTPARSVPWRHIVRNSAFWALLFAHTSYTWGFYTLLNDLPLFLKNILHFDLTEDGVLSSIPYICNYFFMFIQSLAADGCLKRGWISLTALRKTCNSIAFFGSALAMIGVCLAGCDSTAVVSFLCISQALGAFSGSGYGVNHIDLSPKYAGILMGITNTVANCSGFLTPLVIGAIVDANEDIPHWRIVFFMAAAVNTVGNIVFLAFASGKTQAFNDIDDDDLETSRLLNALPFNDDDDLDDLVDL